MGHFTFPDVCCKYNTAEEKQPRKFLKSLEDNFLPQLLSKPTREDAPLELIFVNREGLVGDVMAGERLRHSNHGVLHS